MDPESRLPPAGDIPPPVTSAGKIKCEFCECQLTPTGDVFRISDRAREINKHAETTRKKDEQIAEHEATIRDLRAKLAEATAGRESKDFDLTF